ncbi:MAG: PQQ-dependent dehydrogenase, methanol/ethanol family [Betaproteobacteria bacterium]|nr:PQQ-dependent dehydrogenase, methanol/ethanol family [Betaproteobacteria bacterium]
MSNPRPRSRSCARSIVDILAAGALALCAFSTHASDVSPQRLLHTDSEPQNWLTYYGNYKGWRYSELSQVNTDNVKDLTVKWTFLPGAEEDFQTTPIVVDGVMYIATPKNTVYALDATNGKILWRHDHKLPDNMPVQLWGPSKSRGVSVSGNQVFLATGDGQIIALDAKTGSENWHTVAADYKAGNGFIQPPLIVGDLAIVGTFTAEIATRGFVAAYNVHTGKQAWRFDTIPGPGQPGHETWAGDSWKHGCGPVILPPTYDADMDLIYFGVGNPCPMWNGDVRKGDNLYTNSIVALHPETGRLEWYHQLIPHGVWDLDTFGEVVLVNTRINGRPVRAALQAGKSGYFYAIDRTEGQFLYAKPFVSRITWAKGLDDEGRPIPGVVPGDTTQTLCPGAVSGGKSWNQTAYSPKLDYYFIPAGEVCDNVKQAEVSPTAKPGDLILGGKFESAKGSGGSLTAFDVKTGQPVWKYNSPFPMRSSVLATAGGLLFTGDLESDVLAFDAANGKVLWKFPAGSMPQSSITYSVNGKQYVAVGVGWGQVLANFLPAYMPELAKVPRGSVLLVFALPD